MSARKILITGASGRIGSLLIKKLLERKYDIRVFMHKSRPENHLFDDVEVVKGDLVNRDDVFKATKGIDIVCHLAAAFDIFPPYKYEINNDIVYKINVLGTYNLMEAIRHSEKTNYIVFGSSESIYNSDGKLYEDKINEDTSKSPARFYSLTKILGEDMVKGYKHLYNIDYSILRFSWILNKNDVLRIFEYSTWKDSLFDKDERSELNKAFSKGDALFIPLYEDGSARVEHVVDAEDAASSVVLCIENEEAKGEEFNIAGPYPFKYDDMVEIISKKVGKQWHRGKTSGAYPYELDISKAKKILKYEPKYSIKDTLQKALEEE